MKKLLLAAACLCIISVSLAQKKKESIYLSGNGSPMFYPLDGFGRPFGIGITVDSNTKSVEYHNTIPNQRFNNYVFLNGFKQ